MKRFTWVIILAAHLTWPVAGIAQDYRARVQGAIVDESSGALPGATVTLRNDATGVAVTRPTNQDGRYVFDFVDPGTYTVIAELQGFKAVEQKNVAVQQRGDVTVDLTLAIGTLEERVVVEVAPASVQFNSASKDVTLVQELIDQVPINGRNPYNLATLDATMFNTPGTTEHENRPYHHAFANDYDAGGGTRRANDVLLDGVPLGASFKTAYTPSVDAVEEITISKNSVDAENGHSLGGVISLNMKAGSNTFKGSAYVYGRNPSLNAIADRTVARPAGASETNLRGTKLGMYGATIGGPIQKNRLFFFTSIEQWDDNKPLTIVRTLPTDLERRGDFSQSVLGGRVRNIFDPFSSRVDPAHGTRGADAVCRQRHPVQPVRPDRAAAAAVAAAAQSAWQRGQLARQRDRARGLLERVAARRREHHRQVQGVRALRTVPRQPVSEQPHRRRPVPAVRQQPSRSHHRRRRRLRDVEQDHAQRPRQLLQHDRRVLQPVAADG